MWKRFFGPVEAPGPFSSRPRSHVETIPRTRGSITAIFKQAPGPCGNVSSDPRKKPRPFSSRPRGHMVSSEPWTHQGHLQVSPRAMWKRFLGPVEGSTEPLPKSGGPKKVQISATLRPVSAPAYTTILKSRSGAAPKSDLLLRVIYFKGGAQQPIFGLKMVRLRSF